MNSSSAFALYEVRDRFLSDGHLEPDLARMVRPDILASWRRSQMSGARSGVDALPFEAEITAEGPLVRAAEPVLARLGEQLFGLQAGVLLSDRNARIIRRWAPDPAILRRMDLIASEAGSSGSEQFVGTNGIGTIVEDRKPHLVVGAEHFADVLMSFTCVGAPIFHPLSRRFEGVVTLNADATAASPLLTSLIASTAQEIERRLLEISSRRERALLDAFLVAQRSGRVIAVVGDDVLLAGPQATRVLRDLDQGLLWQEIREALSSGSRQRDSIILSSPQNSLTSLTCSAVLLDGRPIGAVIEVSALAGEPAPSPPLPAAPQWSLPTERLPGHSPAWTAVLRKAALHRDSRAPLLLLGEAGVGKLTLAKAINDGRDVQVIDCLAASRDGAAWLGLAVDLLALPGDHVVVLRHLDALPPMPASALSACLDEIADRPDAPRLMATARPVHHWLDDEVKRRLVDQVGVTRLDVPTMRERREDLPELISHLARRYSETATLRFSPGAMEALSRAPWPGNVRQLENVVRTLVAGKSTGEVTADMLPNGLGAYSAARNLTKMEQLELGAIMEMIERAQGNKVETAKLLGISRSTLYRKMRRYRLDPEKTFF